MGGLTDRQRYLIGGAIVGALIAALVVLYFTLNRVGFIVDTRVGSLSALGDRAFMSLLERRGISVATNVEETSGASSDTDELHVVICRPIVAIGDEPSTIDAYGPPALIVLPKWEASEDPEHPGWVTDAVGLPDETVETFLNAVVGRGRVVRPEGSVTWSTNQLGFSPTLVQPQLFVSSAVQPVVASKDGILVGRIWYGLRSIWILSDPDVIANHGLHRGDNAALALALIRAAMPADGSVVFDVAWPLPVPPPNFEDLPFSFPTAIVTIQVAILCLLLVWAASARFGTPLTLPRTIATGSAALIANMSALLILGGHLREMLERYGEAVVRDVAHRLHAPPGLNERERGAWLARIEAARGVGTNLARLQHRLNDTGGIHARADARHVMALAAAFHQWRQEMIGGPGHNRGR